MSGHNINNKNAPWRTDRHSNASSFHRIRSWVCKTDILQNLDRHICEALLLEGRMQRVPAGAFLFNQGEEANQCYILLSGEVRLLLLTPDGKRVIIDIIGPGMYLGFFVALTGKPYPISAETIEASELYVWDATAIRDHILRTPQLTLNVLSALADRVICLQNKVQQLATERVEQRIAHSLLLLAQHMGKQEEEGILINMPLTHRDLAEMAGTNIYSVSRVLHKWEEQDIIITGRKRILLRSPERLPCHTP